MKNISEAVYCDVTNCNIKFIHKKVCNSMLKSHMHHKTQPFEEWNIYICILPAYLLIFL